MITITPQDIQPKKTAGESCNTRVRKAWSLQMTDAHKDKFKHFPGDVKQQIYRGFDAEVLAIWTDLLKEKNAELKASGATIVKPKEALPHFSDEFAVNTDEVLILAAKIWLDGFLKRSARA